MCPEFVCFCRLCEVKREPCCGRRINCAITALSQSFCVAHLLFSVGPVEVVFVACPIPHIPILYF